MPKACKITQSNQAYLSTRFNVDADDIEVLLPIGYYVVVDFGSDELYDVLNEANYNALFAPTAKELLNDFIEVERI